MSETLMKTLQLYILAFNDYNEYCFIKVYGDDDAYLKHPFSHLKHTKESSMYKRNGYQHIATDKFGMKVRHENIVLFLFKN